MVFRARTHVNLLVWQGEGQSADLLGPQSLDPDMTDLDTML